MSEFALPPSVSRETFEDWLLSRFSGLPTTLYSSFDVRLSNFKVASVDANLFPAGFNNLDDGGVSRLRDCIRDFVTFNVPSCKRVLIVAEGHTRNLAYFRNIEVLASSVRFAGFEVCVSTLVNFDTIALTSWGSGYSRITRDGERVCCDTPSGRFYPDLVVLNADLTGDDFAILDNIDQPVYPECRLGWHSRKKSSFFELYNRIVGDFAFDFGFDPWILSAFYDESSLSFSDAESMDVLECKLELLLEKISKKYLEYSIDLPAAVFVKSNIGTYGLGIGAVCSPSEVRLGNKNFRKKLGYIRSGVPNEEVLLQEAVPSSVSVGGLVAEHVFYLSNSQECGYFYRQNSKASEVDPLALVSNLNGVGSAFVGSREGFLGAGFACEVCVRISDIATRLEVCGGL